MKILQKSSHSTNEYCGDGTTTSTIVSNAIFKEGLRLLRGGFNPVLIKRGMEKAKEEVIKFLQETSYKFDYQDPVSFYSRRKLGIILKIYFLYFNQGLL